MICLEDSGCPGHRLSSLLEGLERIERNRNPAKRLVIFAHGAYLSEVKHGLWSRGLLPCCEGQIAALIETLQRQSPALHYMTHSGGRGFI